MAMRVALAGLVAVAVLFAGWQALPAGGVAGRLDHAAAIVPVAAATPDDPAPAGEVERATGSAGYADSATGAPIGLATGAAAEPDAAATSGVAAAAGPGGPFRAATPIRVPRPIVPAGPRRIGLQVGHWRIDEVPDELRRLEHQTGTSWGAVTEWQLNLDIANRTAAMLRSDGYVVDVLPATVPPGYLADAFVALHADGDTEGSGRGYKAAHGARRGPYEDQFVQDLVAEYGRVTGLPLDFRVTRNMLGYYAFSWTRFKSAAAPHTPAAILEMGFLTSAADRAVLLQRPDLVATGVASGIRRFLDDVPAGAAFADDLVIAPAPFPPIRPPSTTPG
jgi:N-acetylmuramoyl-L-alanine amidase